MTKSYSVIIKREDAEDQKMVQVNFSLVGDEKHGKDAQGYVGLYVDNGTEGYFKNLVIENV